VCVTSVGGSVAQLPLADVPSPNEIDQLVRSPSGSVLLVPRRLKLSGGCGAAKANPSSLPGGLDHSVRGAVRKQVGCSVVLIVHSDSGGVWISRIAVGGPFVRGHLNPCHGVPDLTIAQSSSSPAAPS